jgi:ATP-dependent 26S proteasome regulatory subunit
MSAPLSYAVEDSHKSGYFTGSLEHVLAELQRLDLLIQSQVRRARQLNKTDEQFQGLYISEHEVDELLSAPLGSPRFLTVADPVEISATQAAFERMGEEIFTRAEESMRQGITLRLIELARLFGLTLFDVGCLLICLAPEIDPRYERLYSWIQDDVTRKRPSVELVLNLLCPTIEAKLNARQRFARNAPLMKWKLIEWSDEPSQPHLPFPNRSLRMDERIAGYLLDSDETDLRLNHLARVAPRWSEEVNSFLPDPFTVRLSALAQKVQSGAVLYLHGPAGSGKQDAAAALSAEQGRGLFAIDGEAAARLETDAFEDCVRRSIRESLLQHAALYWNGFDTLLPDEKRSAREMLVAELRDSGRLSFLAGDAAWEPSSDAGGTPFLRIEFPRPAFAERQRMWASALPVEQDSAIDIDAIAGKFRFTGEQIRAAAATAGSLALWRNPASPRITIQDLYESCRLHSNRKLATLARKIKPRYAWDDIILPPDRARHLREICNSVKHRPVVYEKWGFDRKLSLGKGLNILFAGPPGTGKTMAAEIMAGELGLDLYKIDLSSLVSKYIGETEKNLSRIFSEAETSNAILFFDEADALFGKRSEVRDSHDRYANIEVGYLLQRMEEYEGVVILATNFRKNMDDAFVRRIHFTVEFPFPNEGDRRRIWGSIWPTPAPLDESVDLDLLAGRFELTGGSIRNIALAAAFLAAENGGAVNMPHVLHAARREYQKMGKVVMDGEFGPPVVTG